MSGTCSSDRFEALRERLVDYLYGENDAAERAAIEAGMAESEDFRQEVEALARTLRVARRALAAAREPVPAAARTAILAALAAGTERQKSAAQSEPAATDNSARVAAHPKDLLASLRAWWRQPWAYGVVAAASALAIFVFARGQLVDRQSLDEVVSGRLRGAPAPLRPAAVKEGESLGDKAKVVERVAARREEDSLNSGVVSRDRAAVPSGSKVRTASRADQLPEDNGGAALGIRADARATSVPGGPAQPPLARKPVRNLRGASREQAARDDVGAFAARAGEAVAEPPATSKALELAEAPAADRARARTAFADPPAGWHGFRAEAPAPVPHGSFHRTSGPGARPTTAAPSAHGPVRLADGAVVNRENAADSEGEAEDSLFKLGRAELVRRADSLFAAERFAEAARCYRELIRRYPDDPHAGRWRERAARSK